MPPSRRRWFVSDCLPLEYDGVGDTLVVFNRSNPGNSSIIVIGQHFFTDFCCPLRAVHSVIDGNGGNRFGASGVLPEQVMSPNLEQPVLTLPERPRNWYQYQAIKVAILTMIVAPRRN